MMNFRILLSTVLMCVSLATQAAEYRAMVPWPAGSTSDLMMRHIADVFRRNTGDSIVVENVPGANGLIGTERWKSSKNIEIYLTTTSNLVADPVTRSDLPYTDDDFDHAIHISTIVGLWITGPDSNIKKPADLLTRFPDLVGGYSANWNLNIDAMSRHLNRKVDIVNYKGSNDVIRDILGKNLDLAVISNGPNVISLAKSGKLQIIGSTYQNDFAQDGITYLSVPKRTNTPAFSGFVGLALKPDLDPAKSAYLKKELWRAVNTAEMKSLIEGSGNVADYTNNKEWIVRNIMTLRERTRHLSSQTK
jgi:tripartite-type tricarboxylate transporter receptor subunit TctC